MGHHKILQLFTTLELNSLLDKNLHEHILKIVRQYLILGGMPAVLQRFIETHSFQEAHRLQTALLDNYRSDFGKYASRAQFKYLQRFFEKAPLIVDQHFKFTKIDPDARSRDLKIALEQLCWTGLIHRIHATSANGIPLKSEVRENKFKLLFLDIGLMQNANKIDPNALLNEDILAINKGALAEQFVGQELIAYTGFYENPSLFFWEREKRSSSAEVDYVIQLDSKIVPIEVKAGSAGRLKSLYQFMKEKNSFMGIKISQSNLKFEDGLLCLPFYLIEQIPVLFRLKLLA